MANITVREFIKRFEAGEFENQDAKTQINAGWYDWFCRDTSLRNKTRILGRKVVQLAKSELIDQDTMYVFFKNNCPCDGNLFDSFSFCDMETGDVKYWITAWSGYNDVHHGKPVVSTFVGDRREMKFDNWKEVRNFFGV